MLKQGCILSKINTFYKVIMKYCKLWFYPTVQQNDHKLRLAVVTMQQKLG